MCRRRCCDTATAEPGGRPRGPQITGTPFQLQFAIAPGLRHGFEIEFEIIGDEQIQPAVAIVIDERAARAPARPSMQQAGLLRHIGERAVAVVAVKDVLAPVGDEQIVEPVVVVVAHGDRRTPNPCARSPAFSVTSVNVPSRLFLYRRLVAPAADRPIACR